jgi:hypothetical protein
MTVKSPFNVRSPVFLVELSQAGHINNNLGFRRVAQGVIFLRRFDDQVNDVGEAAAAAASFGHGMVDLRRYDQLPTVLVKELDNRIPDVLVRNVIATANQHSQSTRQT